MPSTLPFDTLLSLTQDAVDTATKRLGVTTTAHANAQRQLTMLQDYRQDYLVRLQRMMAQGMASSDCQNYQRFITTLDNALLQQNNVLANAEADLNQARELWQQAQRKHNAFDALLVRDQRARQAIEARREQRTTDEFASRYAARRLANAF